ncbi:MAG: exodeoxyribonuclease V subunit gamma [Clostridiales Family XIII bacterium]|jgi:ATP-dependent helicase/nuclease subunit B|nr:exodeoxyribonuclease V subunit gamma [Clostridiales Family XIII bacterium]
MLTVYAGREDTDREAFMFARIGERLDALESGRDAGRIAVIVPDQFTLQAERDAFYLLKRKGFMRLEIISLSGLRHRVSSETERDARTPVGATGRHMLLSVILRKEAPFLEAFAAQADAGPFIEMMNDLLSELKLHNVSPAEIKDMADAETQPILKRKLSDVSRVYSAYEELIRGKYLDSEDMLRVFASGIPRSAFVQETEIWMYGFDYLAPRDLDIAQALAARARGVNIVLTDALFRITEHMIKALRERAAAAGCVFALRGIDGDFAVRRPPAVAHIERELFSHPCRPWSGGETPELTFLAASDYHTEAESAAAEIARLVRDAGFRYRDILVICNDPDARAAVIRRVFSEYGLPVFMDRRKNLRHNPVLEYISSLMDITALDWRADDIFRLIKTGLSPVSYSQCEMLEEYAKSFRFRGKGSWNKPFERLSPYERLDVETENGAARAERKLSALNGARELLVTHIQRFAEMLNADRGVAGRTAALYMFLRDEARLPERIETDVAALRARGRHGYADELSQVWDSVVSVFDQMAAILEDTLMSREDYASLLSAGLESIEIGLLPSTTDQILVGTMQRTRASRVRALFVLGANDGVLPAAGARDGVLSDDERARVLGRSGETETLDRLRAEEEELAIYRNLSRPEEKLWISYAVSGPEGGELRPSLIFERLRGMFPESVCPLERDIRSRGDASEPDGGRNALCRVSTAGGTLESLLLALRAPSANKALDPVWRTVYEWYRARAPREAAMLDSGFAFSNGGEKRIDRGYVERLYGAYPRYAHDERGAETNAVDPAPSIRLSPSSLERYSRCPFSHFVSYGLRPNETRVVEIGAREIGDVFHKAIMEFSKALTEEGVRVSDADSAWTRLTDADCEKLIDDIFAAMRGETEIFGRGEPERYRFERMRATVGMTARIVAEQVKAGLIDEMYFEERFGAGGKFPAVVHNFGDLTVGIEGRIDRLDVLRGGRAKIIDYKSGAESFDADEARVGWRLQLMLYLDAVTRGTSLKPAGAFYFKMSEPRTDCGSWNETGVSMAERAEFERRKNFRLDGVLIDDQEVLRAIAGDIFEEPYYVNNRSNIIPVRVNKDKTTGKYVLVKNSYNTGALLDEETFERLRGDAARRVRECCEALADGVIDATPMRAGKTSACAYCAYNGICGYDAALGR